MAAFLSVAPYAHDEMNLPVADVDAAIPFYEQTLGFRVESRRNTGPKSAVLARDAVRIGIAENGGDPSQEGCFFAVDDVSAAYEEIRGSLPGPGDLRADRVNGIAHRVFFVVAPDGLCYMIGQPTGEP